MEKKFEWEKAHNETRDRYLKCGVYMMFHSMFPDKIYVGGTRVVVSKRYKESGFIVRWRNHYQNLKNNRHFNSEFQGIVNEFGINGLKFSILEICDPVVCIDRENFFITSLRNAYYLFNKMILATPHGMEYSEERVLLATEGRQMRSVYQFDLNGLLVNTFRKFSDAVASINKGNASIWKCLNGRCDSAYGYYWSYENKFVYDKNKRMAAVVQTQLNGEEIAEYDSIKIASEKTGVGRSSISNCIANRITNAGGFLWKHKI